MDTPYRLHYTLQTHTMPPELREQLEAEIMQLIERDRMDKLGQVQMLLSIHCPDDKLRRMVDDVFFAVG